MNNIDIITKFYEGFKEGNAEKMLECYDAEITFTDPVFGELKGKRAFAMWQMLMSQKKETTQITFSNITANDTTGNANWRAEYFYGEKQRKVINNVSAAFKFKNGKIIEHTDTFNLWTWTKQALGTSGYLLGWSGFMKNKIQATTNKNLDEFIAK